MKPQTLDSLRYASPEMAARIAGEVPRRRLPWWVVASVCALTGLALGAALMGVLA